MRLHRLRLVNFRQHRDTDIEFGPGLTGIIGPNGAGKSTLLEAIAWAIYGMEAARGTRDSIRWRRAKPRSEVHVELEFGLGPHEYRVVRTLYGADLYLDGAPQPIATTLNEVSSRLTRVLGMSRDEFFNTYFTGQKELALMATMKPTERGQFLSRLLGYDKLRLAQERVRERRNALKGELVGLEAGRPDRAALASERERRAAAREEAGRRLAEATEASEATRAASDLHLPVFRELSELRDRYSARVADRRIAEDRVRQVVEHIARLQAEHAAAAAAQAELESLATAVAEYERQRAALAEQDALASDAARRDTFETQLAEIAKQRVELDLRLAESRGAAAEALDVVERLEADRREQEEAERLHGERQAAWVRERQDAESKRDGLREQFKDLQAQRERIVAAGESGVCPTCGQSLGAEHLRSVLELLDAQIAEVTMNGRYFASRVEQLQDPPPELEGLDERRRQLAEAVERGAQALAVATRSAEEAIGLEKQLRRLDERSARIWQEIAALRPGYDVVRRETIRRAVAALEPRAARAQRLAAEAERAARLAGDLHEAEGRRATSVERLATVERELAAMAFTEEAYQAAAREMQRLEEAWRRADVDERVARAELDAATFRLRDVERAEQEALARAARAAEVQGELRLHNELDRALGDLRTELNQEMRPELAALAAEFLAALTDGRYDEIDLDEEYRVTVLEDGEPQTVISGGEEDLTNLVLRFAVSQMIADRSGQPLTLLVLDEIFGSLDEPRRAQVVHLLRGLEARFPQVVLITHIEGVRESLDRVLRVRYDEASGSAVVTEERSAPPTLGGADADVAA
ncbi:MAG: SMC family ATPase [Gemmatimonadetes bacterium]|nr:SMC family ATPase [Gemmatimonadota bacterium]